MNELFETLAALEHEQWVKWAKTLIEKEKLSPERVERWNKLFVPYAELSEGHKEQDREWARKVLLTIHNTLLDFPEHTQGLILKEKLLYSLYTSVGGKT